MVGKHGQYLGIALSRGPLKDNIWQEDKFQDFADEKLVKFSLSF